jgi:HSP20 family protein
MNDQTPVSVQKEQVAPAPRGAPASPFDWLRGEIDRLFDDFGRPGTSLFNFGTRPGSALAPAVEFAEEDKAYRLTAELPGLSEQDIEVSVADGRLSISGEKKEESERSDKGLIMSERRYGSFQRQIALPADVDENAITAQFKDGVLTVVLAKDESAPARSRKIEIGRS